MFPLAHQQNIFVSARSTVCNCHKERRKFKIIIPVFMRLNTGVIGLLILEILESPLVIPLRTWFLLLFIAFYKWVVYQLALVSGCKFISHYPNSLSPHVLPLPPPPTLKFLFADRWTEFTSNLTHFFCTSQHHMWVFIIFIKGRWFAECLMSTLIANNLIEHL